LKLANCVDLLKKAYVAVGNCLGGADSKKQALSEAIQNFVNILHIIPLIVVDKKEQVQEVLQLIEICREYITALRLETARGETTDVSRQILLSAYVSRCKLQPTHLILVLKTAIQRSYQAKNFKTCAGFCRRVLELCVTSNKQNVSKLINVDQIRTVLKACERVSSDAVDLKYNETDALVLCCDTFTPLSNAITAAVRCPFCQSTYRLEAKGSLCRTCNLSKIAAEATGLRVFPDK